MQKRHKINKQELEEKLIPLIQKHSIDNKIFTSSISSLKLFTTNEKSEFQSIIYEPSICIAVQGSKAVGFGTDMYSYNSSKYLLTCTNVPANIKIESASKTKPYVSLVLKFSMEEIYEVMKELNIQNDKSKKKIQSPFRFNPLDETLLDPVYRLVKLLDKQSEIKDFMTPLIKKEIIFLLLQTNEDFLKNYVLEGTLTNQIVKAISEIKNNYNTLINMTELSKKIGVSEASLYQNFKKITTMSPLQYQKKIRLEEAKFMLASKDIEASEAAFAVGYESPSQFSREYSRMFGMSPKAHSELLKSNQTA